MTREARRSSFLILFSFQVLAIATGATPALASQGFTFQKVVLQGETAPGTEPGTVFAPLQDIYITSVPALDQSGTVSFVAILQGPAITATNRTGIWSWNQGTLTRITRAGESAPETSPGGTFASFPIDFALTPPTVGGGRLGFGATITGPGINFANDEGLWALSGGVLQLFAREGGPAPGLPSGVSMATPSRLEVNALGHAFIAGSLAGIGIDSDNNEAFWSDREGEFAVLVREGDPAPGMSPGVLVGGAGEFIGTGYTFGSLVWSPASRLAIQASVTGPGVTTFNNEALFIERANALAPIAREGDAAPGAGNGNTFGAGSVMADFGMVAFNALEQVAFTARVGGSTPLTYLLYSSHTGTLAPIARPGEPAPGTAQTFGIVTDPTLSDGGRIAFRASLSGSGAWPPLGLWWDQPGEPGQLFAVAVPGDAAPGRPGVTIVSVQSILDFNAFGQLAFLAVLDDPPIGQRTALFLVEPSGQIREIVATGDLFDAQGSSGPAGDPREISAIHFGSLNASGRMAIRLDFADGSFGHYGVSSQTTAVFSNPAPEGIQLTRNVPNPFGVATRFEFALPERARVQVTVHDAAGRRVRRLLDEPRAAGPHAVLWDGRDQAGSRLPSGVYWARFHAGPSSRSMGVVLLKQ